MGELEIGSLLKFKCESLTYSVIYYMCARISTYVYLFIHYTVYTQIFMFQFVHVCNRQYIFLHTGWYAAVMREARKAEQQCVITQLRKKKNEAR